MRAKVLWPIRFATSWTSSGDTGTCVRFRWIQSHCGIKGNYSVNQITIKTTDRDKYSGKSVVCWFEANSHLQYSAGGPIDTGSVFVHGRNIFFLKLTVSTPNKFQPLNRAEEFVITCLRISHTNAIKSHILSIASPTTMPHCEKSLAIDHMLLECALLQESREEYYISKSLKTVFEKIPTTRDRDFPKMLDFPVWYERSNTIGNSSVEPAHNWCNSELNLVPTTGQYNRTY